MVSSAKAKEIAGNHVDQLVGGPQTGYRVSGSTTYGPNGPHDVTVDVWRTPDERDQPRKYLVDIDEDGTITDSHWEDGF